MRVRRSWRSSDGALRHGRIVIALYGGFLLGGFLGQEPHANGEISPCVLKKPRRL
jgi:hypothetical protein